MSVSVALALAFIAQTRSAMGDIGGLRGAANDNSSAEMQVNTSSFEEEDPRLEVLSLSQVANWHNTAGCSMRFMGSDLSGVDVEVTTVSGNSDAELDSLCCGKCGRNAACEFWVREAGTSGSKTCWLKKDAGSYTVDSSRCGAHKANLRTTPRCSLSSFVDQDLTGLDVDVITVGGNPGSHLRHPEHVLDSLCCEHCERNADCEFWVREEGMSGPKKCWLKRKPGNFVHDTSRRGAFKPKL